MRSCKSIWGALISDLASSVFAVLGALSTVLEVLQRYLMCTKHQLGDNLGDDSPAHYLLTCTFNRILRIVLSTSLVTLLIAEISLEMVIFFMSLIMHALSNPYILIRYRFDQNILLTLRICNQHADFTNRIWNLHKLGIKTLINFKSWIKTKWRGSVSNIFCWLFKP